MSIIDSVAQGGVQAEAVDAGCFVDMNVCRSIRRGSRHMSRLTCAVGVLTCLPALVRVMRLPLMRCGSKSAESSEIN